MTKIDIYRSFEQWKNGNVLEHGVPRTEYYSEAQLDLVEMGWKYGYDAGRAVEQSLDKKAENARELGLDYEVEPKIGCVNHDFIRMAREVGLEEAYSLQHNQFLVQFRNGSLERFATLVRADAIVKEREACAKVADGYIGADPIAAAIRARGNK